MSIFPGPKLVAGCFVIDAGRILLLRRGIMPRIGEWTFPGGYVDLGETSEQAALRETAEEVGMNVRLGAMLGLFSDPANPLAAVAVYLAEPGSETPGLSDGSDRGTLFRSARDSVDELAFHTTVASLKAARNVLGAGR